MTRGMLFGKTVEGKSASARKGRCRWGCTVVRKDRPQTPVWAILKSVSVDYVRRDEIRTWSARPFRSRSYREKKDVEEIKGWKGSRSSNLIILTEPVVQCQ